MQLAPNAPVLSLDIRCDPLIDVNRQPDESAWITDEALGLAAGTTTRDLNTDLCVEGCRRRAAASDHETQLDSQAGDLLVVHGLTFAMRTQDLLSGIKEGQSLPWFPTSHDRSPLFEGSHGSMRAPSGTLATARGCPNNARGRVAAA